MDEAIKRFYEIHEVSLEKQISARPKGITPGQIEAAAEFIYRHKEGIEPVMLVREVRRIAKEIDASKYRESDHVREAGLVFTAVSGRVEDFRVEVQKFEKQLQRIANMFQHMKGVLEAHSIRVERVVWSNRILVIIIILMLVGVLAGVWKGEWNGIR